MDFLDRFWNEYLVAEKIFWYAVQHDFEAASGSVKVIAAKGHWHRNAVMYRVAEDLLFHRLREDRAERPK